LRGLAALLPPAVQRLKHSRKRAGLTGTPAAFSSSASWPLLQPLRCSVSKCSRNGSSKSAAVLRFLGGARLQRQAAGRDAGGRDATSVERGQRERNVELRAALRGEEGAQLARDELPRPAPALRQRRREQLDDSQLERSRCASLVVWNISRLIVYRNGMAMKGVTYQRL
jgi:hypothetical protein